MSSDTEDTFTEEQMENLRERGLSDEDASFILSIFEEQGKSVLETYEHLIHQFDNLGKTKKYVVAQVELDSAVYQLKQMWGFTDEDIAFLREFCDNNIFKMKKVIDEDVLGGLSRGGNKNEAMVRLVTRKLLNMEFTQSEIDASFNNNKGNYIATYKRLTGIGRSKRRKTKKGYRSTRKPTRKRNKTIKRRKSIKKKKNRRV